MIKYYHYNIYQLLFYSEENHWYYIFKIILVYALLKILIVNLYFKDKSCNFCETVSSYDPGEQKICIQSSRQGFNPTAKNGSFHLNGCQDQKVTPDGVLTDCRSRSRNDSRAAQRSNSSFWVGDRFFCARKPKMALVIAIAKMEGARHIIGLKAWRMAGCCWMLKWLKKVIECRI